MCNEAGYFDALCIQPDNKIVAGSDGSNTNNFIRKIVAVGYTSKLAQPAKFAIARYMPDGTADSSFGFAGRTETDIEPFDTRASSVVSQPDGNIIAAGYSSKDNNGTGQGGYFALARYLKKKKTAGFIAGKSSEIKISAVQKSLSVYPNPARNLLFIKACLPCRQNMRL